jgi:hypothetical protein
MYLDNRLSKGDNRTAFRTFQDEIRAVRDCQAACHTLRIFICAHRSRLLHPDE